MAISTSRQGAQLTQQRAERLAATLPPLLVHAERVAATVAQGVHGRRRVGSGDTFWQFRRYEPGDPTQRIDWRRSAKSDTLFVRESEWEAAASVWLWCDRSPSMRYRSSAALSEKAERAALLVLALAALLVRGDEHIALLGSGLSPRPGRAALNRMALMLERQLAEGLPTGEHGSGSLPAYELLPRHGQLVLIGDLLAPLEEIDALVRRFAGRGVKGHLLELGDPAEETLPFAGRTRFEGLEGEGEVLVRRVDAVREAYVARRTAHRAGLAAIARAVGWNFTTHRTDQPPEGALLALYAHLSASWDEG
ncbi:MAG TPA: DUF58 domain-containing protein [Alphaproteobacteria bacterium]|nr:DUF58 domain-containing protein [Alphaproteobacteria bacterium]